MPEIPCPSWELCTIVQLKRLCTTLEPHLKKLWSKSYIFQIKQKLWKTCQRREFSSVQLQNFTCGQSQSRAKDTRHLVRCCTYNIDNRCVYNSQSCRRIGGCQLLCLWHVRVKLRLLSFEQYALSCFPTPYSMPGTKAIRINLGTRYMAQPISAIIENIELLCLNTLWQFKYLK